MAQTSLKRFTLETAYAASVAKSTTLRAELVSLGMSYASSSGFTSTSGNGRSATMSEAGISAKIEACDELIQLLDEVENDSVALTTDAQKYAEMKGRLIPVRCVQNDYSCLRIYG